MLIKLVIWLHICMRKMRIYRQICRWSWSYDWTSVKGRWGYIGSYVCGIKVVIFLHISMRIYSIGKYFGWRWWNVCTSAWRSWGYIGKYVGWRWWYICTSAWGRREHMAKYVRWRWWYVGTFAWGTLGSIGKYVDEVGDLLAHLYEDVRWDEINNTQ